MDVQAAIAVAKSYVDEIFGPEGASDIGLEEVKFDPESQSWDVTVGFTRPWERRKSPLMTLETRTYKVVRIDNQTGAISSVSNRRLSSGG